MVRKRELTDEERNMAERLRHVWERQRKALDLTQEAVAHSCGWSTQGAFGHYLTGKNPLNIDAVFKLSTVLKVDPREIMPSLHDILVELFPSLVDQPGIAINDEVLRMAWEIQNLAPRDRATLKKVIDALVQQKEGNDLVGSG